MVHTGPGKAGKSWNFFGIFQDWIVLERLLFLESSGNVLNLRNCQTKANLRTNIITNVCQTVRRINIRILGVKGNQPKSWKNPKICQKKDMNLALST